MNSATIDFIILIPCYNNEIGLIESIKSINYPTEKFELLIIDDGSKNAISSDKIKSVLASINFEIIRLNENKGIAHALNTGLEVIKKRNDFKYVARLDAGDICYKERFTKQVDYLNKNLNIFLLGTWCKFQDVISKKSFNYITKTKHSEIIKEMHYKCSFIHPTVMFRKEVIDSIGYYPTNFKHCEDYAYFWEILKKHKGAILPELLVSISVSNENLSSKNYKIQLKSRIAIVKHYGTNAIDKAIGLFLLSCRRMMPSILINKIKFK